MGSIWSWWDVEQLAGQLPARQKVGIATRRQWDLMVFGARLQPGEGDVGGTCLLTAAGKATSHEGGCDGEKAGGEQEQTPSSCLQELQQVRWSEMGLLSKMHTRAVQKKSRKGLLLGI